MQKQIYGSIELNEKIYPFILIGRTIHIVQHILQYYKDFSSKANIPFIHGVTYDNRDILFLKCELKTTLNQIIFTTEGYIISLNNTGTPYDFRFDCLSFYSDALNTFYSPQRAAALTDTDFNRWDGSMNISIKPFTETDTSFKFRDADCTFSIGRSKNLIHGTSSIGSLDTSFIMSFNEIKSPELVCQYYLNVFDFLSFVNYSKNITFNEIILLRKCIDKNNRYERIAQAIIFTNASDYSNDNFNSIIFEDIPKDKIGAVFEKAATLRENDNRICYYYLNSTEESRYIDNNKWLMTALCFEGLFQTTHPNFKSSIDENFDAVKQGILNAIDDYANSTVFSKKQNKYFNDIKNHIKRYEGVLEGKFNFTLKEYKEALSDIITLIQKKFGTSATTNYGNLYQSYRNKLAHGDIEIMGDDEIAVYRLLCPMIYILILKDIELDIQELRKIINKLFDK